MKFLIFFDFLIYWTFDRVRKSIYKIIFDKLRYIRELNSKFGMIHSNIEGVVIDRKTVENIDAYLLK